MTDCFLLQYFDSMDLPQITVEDLENPDEVKTLLMRIIDNSYILTRSHRKSQEVNDNLRSEINQLKQKQFSLEVSITASSCNVLDFFS